jgi:hypothetical protein
MENQNKKKISFAAVGVAQKFRSSVKNNRNSTFGNSSRKSMSPGRRSTYYDGKDLTKSHKVIMHKRSLSKEGKSVVNKINRKQRIEQMTNNIRNKMNFDMDIENKNKKKPKVDDNFDLKSDIVQYRKDEPIPVRSHLAMELEDPANEYLRSEIQKIMHVTNEVNNLSVDLAALSMVKDEMEVEINDLLKKDKVNQKKPIKEVTCKYKFFL